MSENADKNFRRRKNKLESKSADVIDQEELISKQTEQREIDDYIRRFDEEIKSCFDCYESNICQHDRFFELITELQQFCAERNESNLFRERVEPFYQNLEYWVEDSDDGDYKDIYLTLNNYRRLYELTGIAPPPPRI